MYDQEDVEALERQFNAAMEEADTGPALDALRRIYDEFAAGGTESLSGLLHPEFELHMETLFLDGKSYRGVRGFMNWRREMEELFEEQHFQPEGVHFASDDRFVVLGRLHLKGKGNGVESGVELDVPLAHVFEQRDKKVARFTAYSDISAALAAAGLPG